MFLIMKITKVKSREYNGKTYYRYRINIPSEELEKAGLKEGDELQIKSQKNALKMWKKVPK